MVMLTQTQVRDGALCVRRLCREVELYGVQPGFVVQMRVCHEAVEVVQ